MLFIPISFPFLCLLFPLVHLLLLLLVSLLRRHFLPPLIHLLLFFSSVSFSTYSSSSFPFVSSSFFGSVCSCFSSSASSSFPPPLLLYLVPLLALAQPISLLIRDPSLLPLRLSPDLLVVILTQFLHLHSVYRLHFIAH